LGDPLSKQGLQSFAEELELLEKDAFVGQALRSAGQWALKAPGRAGQWALKAPGRVGEGIQETARRGAGLLTSPRKTLKAGWREMGPEAKDIPAHLQAGGGGGGGRTKEFFKGLGRGGWTGRGEVTKYVPNVMGLKALTVGSSALALPEIAAAAKRDPTATGEGGVAELGLGEAAGLAGMIAGGRRILPSMALYMLGRKAGGGAGRLIDRMRGGADLPTAVSAPSPQEAQQQLANIYRHYG